jgi:hypothetical protein
MAMLAAIVPASSAQTTPDSKTLENLPPLQPARELKASDIPPLGPPKPAEKWEQGKEVADRRTESTKTFMGDKPGKFEERIYPEPVHFQRDNSWVEIDPTLVVSGNGRRNSKANRFELSLSESSDDPAVASLVIDEQHSVASMAPPRSRARPPRTRSSSPGSRRAPISG